MLNDRAQEILHEQCDMLEKKGQDYNGTKLVSDDDYHRFQLIPGIDMMNTKLLRYVSAMDQKDNVNYESADDSLRDLINYAARTIAYNEVLNYRQRVKDYG